MGAATPGPPYMVRVCSDSEGLVEAAGAQRIVLFLSRCRSPGWSLDGEDVDEDVWLRRTVGEVFGGRLGRAVERDVCDRLIENMLGSSMCGSCSDVERVGVNTTSCENCGFL